MTHLHLLMNNPTAGAIDGTEISSDGGSLPLSFRLNAGENEQGAQKIAVRCDQGFEVEGNCDIYASGTSVAQWSFAEDEGYVSSDVALVFADWEQSLAIADVHSVNSVFWVRASSSSLESPANDVSVKIIAEGLVVEIDG